MSSVTRPIKVVKLKCIIFILNWCLLVCVWKFFQWALFQLLKEANVVSMLTPQLNSININTCGAICLESPIYSFHLSNTEPGRAQENQRVWWLVSNQDSLWAEVLIKNFLQDNYLDYYVPCGLAEIVEVVRSVSLHRHHQLLHRGFCAKTFHFNISAGKLDKEGL